MNKSKKIYPWINLFFKVIVAICSIGYLFYVLFYQKNEYLDTESGQKVSIGVFFLWNHLLSILNSHPESIIALLFTILLAIINWGTEVLKWKILMSKLLKVNYQLAIRSILGGIAASNITPYKLGGFFARVGFVPQKHRIKGASIILLGDFSQLLMTLFFGSLAILLLTQNNFSFSSSSQEFQQYSLSLIAGSTFFCSVIGCLLFLNLKRCSPVLKQLPFLKHWENVWDLAREHGPANISIQLLCISCIRFFAIALQYYLVFNFLGMQLDLYHSLLIISSLLIIFNFLPTFNIIEFGITKTAILMFLLETFIDPNYVTLDIALIVSCGSFIIWLINLALPSAIGSFHLLKIKLLNHQ